ncbi:MAG TPA: hypothetical protein VFB80_06130 [Pirellulaceae bacterium]|nr:hypothetical protein [Pirellulaceae bacterium]
MLQVIAGCVVRTLPNWSREVAVSCRVPLFKTVALAGLTEMLDSVWTTVTVALLTAIWLSASRIATAN